MCSNVFDIDDLTKRFLCCTPINTLNLMISKHSTDYLIDFTIQKAILENTVNNTLVKQYPIKHSYQRAFLKWLMSKIEEKGHEIHDDIYTTYCNLISLTSDECTHYRHFAVENGTLDYITVQESTNIISEGTTGLCSWQGAVALNKWCIENKTELCGKTVLELGCGVGLSGLSIISTCAPKEYIFSDCHQAVLAMVCENVKLNLLRFEKEAQAQLPSAISRLKLQVKYNDTTIKVMELKWEDIDTYLTEQWTIPDIIIAADILYERDSFFALVTGLKAFLSFDGRYAVIAATIRNADTISHFLDELGVHNLFFEEYTLPEQKVCIQLANSPIRILKIFQKR